MDLTCFGLVLRPFIQRLNFCDFSFIGERGEFDGNITKPSYRCKRYICIIFKKTPS